MLHRDPTPLGGGGRRDPVVALSALLLAVVAAGLLVLAIVVVASYGITGPGDKSQPQMISADFVAPFALVIAIVFFAVLLLNVVAAAVRHFRPGR
jgi:hypothetical protein